MKSGFQTITKQLKNIRKIGSTQKLIIIFILSVCFIIGLAVPFIIQNQNNFNSNNPQMNSKESKAQLDITSNKKSLKLSQSFTVTVSISSPVRGVEAADFFIRFDPNYLDLVSSSPGSFFPVYPIFQKENGYFKLSGTAKKLDDGFIIPKGRGTVATLLFKAIKPVNATLIEIDESKTIVASEGENILGKINNLKIKISE